MIGSWVSYAEQGGIAGPWVGNVTGASNSSGTITVETPVWPNLPWVARVTMMGAWERTGGNTFAFTQIGFVPAADGTPLFIAKNVGTETITDDCNTLTVVSTMQLFLFATGEPFTEALPVEPPMIAHRIGVESP